MVPGSRRPTEVEEYGHYRRVMHTQGEKENECQNFIYLQYTNTILNWETFIFKLSGIDLDSRI